MDDALLLIDKLDDMVRNGGSVRRGAHVRLDRREAYELLDAMRRTIPEEIRQARWIADQRSEMLAEARLEAERVVAEAREERARLVGPDVISTQAEQRAERVLEGARGRARQIRLGAEGYADEILGSLETGLGKLATAGRVEH